MTVGRASPVGGTETGRTARAEAGRCATHTPFRPSGRPGFPRIPPRRPTHRLWPGRGLRGFPCGSGDGMNAGVVRVSGARPVGQKPGAFSSGTTISPLTTTGTPSSDRLAFLSGMSRWQAVSLVPPSSVFGPSENSTLP